MAEGYGTDTWCGPGGIRTGRFASRKIAFAHACFRRLTTPRGTLRGGKDEENYGLDLVGVVGALAEVASDALPGLIEGELAKDDRTLTVDVTVSSSTKNTAVSFVIEIQVVGVSEEESFTLTLSVSETSVQLLGIS